MGCGDCPGGGCSPAWQSRPPGWDPALSCALLGTWRSEPTEPRKRTQTSVPPFPPLQSGPRVCLPHVGDACDLNANIACPVLGVCVTGGARRSGRRDDGLLRPRVSGPQPHSESAGLWVLALREGGREHGSAGWAGPRALGGASSRCQLEPTHILALRRWGLGPPCLRDPGSPGLSSVVSPVPRGSLLRASSL